MARTMARTRWRWKRGISCVALQSCEPRASRLPLTLLSRPESRIGCLSTLSALHHPSADCSTSALDRRRRDVVMSMVRPSPPHAVTVRASRQYRSGNRNCALYPGICAPYVLVTCWQALGRLDSELRKLGIWEFVGPSCCDPRGVLGNSETRNLEFGGRPLGSDPRGGLGDAASETRKLGIWNMPRSILESAHSESWNLEFAEEYPGICP